MIELESEYRQACPGCLAQVSELHEDNCDVARCGVTGAQLFSCNVFNSFEPHECVNTTWSGYWPGVQECFEYGLFTYFGPEGFVKCGPDHPEAVCDLNTLIVHYRWDAKLQKRIKR